MNYVIASVTKQFIFLTFSILLALLAACGDESSSSVSPDPRSCEDQNEDCDDTSSSSGEVSKNSSSSQKNSNKEKSSSSEKNAKESSSSTTTKNSSSSVSGDKSSSSVKKEDSSSSAVKESSSSATPKSSSSEEVKQSSSSVVASSSSDEEESSSSSYDRTIAFNGTLWRAGEYKTFVDARDNREYYYIQITGEDTTGKAATIKVMAENLNVGEKVYGFKDQKDDTKIERYCYDDDTTNCNKYGGLYQWAEMMQLPSRCNTESCADLIKPNHQGICPDGWRLLTYNDYYIVVHADNNKYGVEGTRAGRFGGSNDSGYSLIGAGYRSDEGGVARLGDYTIWFYPEEQNSQEHRSSCNGMNPNKTTISLGYQSKVTGSSVRCVMVE